MSSNDPCKCEDQKPGYGGMCTACGKECFAPEEEPHHDYRCRECRNLVLYRSDHKQDCVHYPEHLAFHWRMS